MMEVSLPSESWRGKGSARPTSHLLNWERGCLGGLACQNSTSALASAWSAQDLPSPAPPVSIRAGGLEWEGPGTGASATGGYSVGVSWVGPAVGLAAGLLEPATGPSAWV